MIKEKIDDLDHIIYTFVHHYGFDNTSNIFFPKNYLPDANSRVRCSC